MIHPPAPVRSSPQVAVLREHPPIWDHYTRVEEYSPRFLDNRGRFPYAASSCCNVFDPVASQVLAEHGLRPSWPDDHGFGVCLTHDIDWVYMSPLAWGRAAMAHLVRDRGRRSFGGLVKAARMGKKWPLCNFETTIAVEEGYGATSSFFFLVQSPGEEDYSYEIETLDAEFGTILDHGCEVGLHGGFSCCRNLDQLLMRKARLEAVIGRPVVGYRNHYLCFDVPSSWEILSQAGFLYDTTFGYHDCIGFRNGMCYPFYPFNLNCGREIDILEIPLVISDAVLFAYMRLDLDQAWTQIRALIDRVEEVNGVITILWHNKSMLGSTLTLYCKILKYCSEHNAWMTSGHEIAEWWMKHAPG